MKMKKQHLIIFFCLFLVGFIAGIYQYVITFRAGDVSAVTVSTPDPGHTWSSMECSADSLCIDTVNNRLGIGTNTPSEKLTVGGNLSITGSMTGGTVPAARIGAGTLSGSYAFNSDVSVGGYKLTNVAAPVSSTDAATKAYVDASSGGVCYTVFGSSSCYSGYTAVVVGVLTVALNGNASAASGAVPYCSAVAHDNGAATGWGPQASSSYGFLPALHDEACAICCK